MRTPISIDQEEEVVRLYRAQKHTVKQIMALTGVRSEQTVYRILDERNIPRLKIRKPIRKISICLDYETDEILKRAKPKNVSEWVCKMIVKGYSNR